MADPKSVFWDYVAPTGECAMIALLQTIICVVLLFVASAINSKTGIVQFPVYGATLGWFLPMLWLALTACNALHRRIQKVEVDVRAQGVAITKAHTDMQENVTRSLKALGYVPNYSFTPGEITSMQKMPVLTAGAKEP